MAVQIFILLIGVALGAASVVFIKASSLHPVALASYRLIMAAVLLLPFYFRDLARVERKTALRALRASVIPGLLLGLHFISWITGARMTTAANATLIVNMVPIIMPFFAYLFLREVLTPVEIAGTVCALGGIIYLGITDFHLSVESFRGDIISFIAMVLFALYLILGRRHKSTFPLWLYLVPLYLIGGIFCFIVTPFFAHPFRGISWFEVLMIGGLAVLSTIGGHSIFNYSMRHLRSQIVTLVNVAQVLFGALYGFLFFGEVPGRNFVIAAPIIAGGACIVIIFSRKKNIPKVDPEDVR